jgi:hypothetical protein
MLAACVLGAVLATLAMTGCGSQVNGQAFPGILPRQARWESCERKLGPGSDDFECGCFAGSSGSPVLTWMHCMRARGHAEYAPLPLATRCTDGEACDRRECEAEELVIPAEGRTYFACLARKGY